MKRLSKEQILMLHSQLIEQTGGIDGVRAFRLFESLKACEDLNSIVRNICKICIL